MSPSGNEQAVRALDSEMTQLLDLGVERAWVHHDSVSDYARALIMKDARRNQMKHELALADSNGMPGVVAALISRDYVEVRRENINDLAFAFVAPLGSDYHDVFHNDSGTTPPESDPCVTGFFFQTDVQAHTDSVRLRAAIVRNRVQEV
jgi:hypothetical protein